MKDFERIENIHLRAYDMYPQKAKPYEHVENPFPMYSYERAASMFWDSFIGELFDKGLSEKEVEWLMRSKHMRWMFDGGDREFDELVKKLIHDDMIKDAKQNG